VSCLDRFFNNQFSCGGRTLEENYLIDYFINEVRTWAQQTGQHFWSMSNRHVRKKGGQFTTNYNNAARGEEEV
jgi:hypothetical protein